MPNASRAWLAPLPVGIGAKVSFQDLRKSRFATPAHLQRRPSSSSSRHLSSRHNARVFSKRVSYSTSLYAPNNTSLLRTLRSAKKDPAELLQRRPEAGHFDADNPANTAIQLRRIRRQQRTFFNRSRLQECLDAPQNASRLFDASTTSAEPRLRHFGRRQCLSYRTRGSL